VGIDRAGSRHILALELYNRKCGRGDGLLTRLRDQGLQSGLKYLFVIDAAKALRAGIEQAFGSDQAVQRCRNLEM
jgi:hypothetical protein